MIYWLALLLAPQSMVFCSAWSPLDSLGVTLSTPKWIAAAIICSMTLRDISQKREKSARQLRDGQRLRVFWGHCEERVDSMMICSWRSSCFRVAFAVFAEL